MTYLSDYWEWERGDVIRRIGELEAELERARVQLGLCESRVGRTEVRLGRAGEALREITEIPWMDYRNEAKVIARHTLAEIEES